MEHLMYINLNKLSSFMFELKHKIDLSISNREILDSYDCTDYIRKFILNKDNVFQYNTDEALDNLVEQIFLFYYGDENIIDLPLIDKYKTLSLLN